MALNTMFRTNNGQQSDEPLLGAIYPRVSTDEQVNNTSLKTQIENCMNMAQRYGIIVPENRILSEDESGMTLNRPQLNILRELVRNHQINALIINSSDRLSRKPGHAEELLDE